MWIINGFTSAFFASLERCSCIRIKTKDDGDEGTDDMPLVSNDGNSHRDSGGRRRRRRMGKQSGSLLDL
ncbi:hypothetical protein Leryth_015623 [Lithospermum erythrorhizon]|nr:hypothetical protein Leryth_015623 [Lithospermum erythrorhizon]